MVSESTIFVVDDDPAVSQALAATGRFMGVNVEAFGSADAFLANYDYTRPGCLVLDVKMPGMSGLELQKRLVALGNCPPIVMISGHGDVRMVVDAMSAGAVTFVEKPFGMTEISGHIEKALQLDLARREHHGRQAVAARRLAALTSKQRDLLMLITAGMSNKQMALKLGVSLRAVEDRRARLMKALEVESLAALLTLARDAGVDSAGSAAPPAKA